MAKVAKSEGVRSDQTIFIYVNGQKVDTLDYSEGGGYIELGEKNEIGNKVAEYNNGKGCSNYMFVHP